MADVLVRRFASRRLRVAVPLLLLAAVPGCTRTGADAVASQNRFRSEGPTATLPLTADVPIVDLHRGGTRPRATAWADAAVAADGRSLLVRFESRGPGCDWLDHIDTDETNKHVRITVYLAENPEFDNQGDGPPTICGAPPRFETARVALSSPLRGRPVFDAAAGEAARPVARLAG